MLANIFDGIMSALSMSALLANLMGVALGIIFGALPGLTAAMGVALGLAILGFVFMILACRTRKKVDRRL